VAKLGLVQAGLAQGQWVIVTVSLAVSLLTLFSMIKLWNEAFWKANPEDVAEPRRSLAAVPTAGLVAPIVLLAAVTIFIGLGAGPLYALALRAAEQLMLPTDYVRAVLGMTP
jgi:multicomponent Na+:H+ antiporter subunit D